MHTTDITVSLNEKQRLAVTAGPEHQLILAGAGSGKTRVLIQRIAWLIQEMGVSPHAIMAVTFTNKAANEMRARLTQTLGMPIQNLWVGTFHGLAHRLLRLHWQAAQLPEAFQILDSDDQLRMIKRVMKTLEIDEERWPPKQAQHFINQKKDQGLRSNHIDPNSQFHIKTHLEIYREYEATCQRTGVVDFAELLLRSYELWRDNEEVRTHYQQRFEYILVDEFQDTNDIQYAWLRLLITNRNYLTVVGDDDQSIYGWRGAKIENIQKFTRDFLGTNTIRLEQNYRSTQHILSAANALIDHNENRLGKTLWTEAGAGEKITLRQAFNEIDESQFVVSKIKEWVRQGSYQDIAILYRSNAQSRIFEEALITSRIPYRIYGGHRFFERAEIKDALAYLRIIVNPNDDSAFERIINWPPRGVGDRTLEHVRDVAKVQQVSLWYAARETVSGKTLPGRAVGALEAFITLTEKMQHAMAEQASFQQQVEYVIHTSGLLTHFKTMRDENRQARVENLEELITAAGQFSAEGAQEEWMNAFLAHAALEAGEEQADSENSVRLMTLHTAKGLEFPLVFLVGMEEGLFPHQMALQEGSRLEEERRLCYVGMTRAMRKLVISFAESRNLYGRHTTNRPSRFIAELPEGSLEAVSKSKQKWSSGGGSFAQKPRTSTTSEGFSSSMKAALKGSAPANAPFRLGERVRHAKFGEGVVLAIEGQGEYARIHVNFKAHGTKWLMLSIAKLVSSHEKMPS